MQLKHLYHIVQRTRTFETDRIYALPVVILMPHSACNCKCIMCDIWKNNKNLKQLTEDDVSALLSSLKKFGTQQVVMSGGEALLNPNFFNLCVLLKMIKVKITLLSTGITMHKHAAQLVNYVDNVIVSLDGDEQLHDQIRRIPGAFRKMKEGLSALRSLKPDFKVTARTVIHEGNFRKWTDIITAAKSLGIQQISFLPADVSSEAFNRQIPWNRDKQNELLVPEEALPELARMVEKVVAIARRHPGLIAETPEKLYNIYRYYAAFYNLNPFPFSKCNAPWVSAVIEADGNVRPCFFHQALGNIHDLDLKDILNNEKAIFFRKMLKFSRNEICAKCVCSLNLPATQMLN